MDIFKAAERLMKMDETTWARHAGPWSIYTRIATGPIIFMVLWFRLYFGWWTLALLAAFAVFIWANPRLFPGPKNPAWWGAKVTYGERVFLNRKAIPVPDHHLHWAKGLTAISVIGIGPLTYGLWVFDLGWTTAGALLVVGGKLWFCDRMVWLYNDMRAADPTYFSWAVKD
ncbi:hypothetical protein L0666_14670 [Octadecabacter sp. CECT 8868]|uniref:DUF6653 family protein n=1 Tax=Octadecabacter algicola TaxID=2909342 RepID=UPI001F1C6211|nr:DUF6653 family protein [Octadecabacter algicola]MCF2906237.1 hypothetical protein [Octadecabacter algicola]